MEYNILKYHWERNQAHVSLEIETVKHLVSPLTKKPIRQISLLSQGCANTNYKVEFESKHVPLVLRLHVRDKKAVNRELAIYEFVKKTLPVAQILYTDDSCNLIDTSYTLMKFVPGKLMRDVLLEGNHKAISQCAYSAGIYLDRLRKITFDIGGFFEESMIVTPFDETEQFDRYLHYLLGQENVIRSLSPDIITKLHHIIEQYKVLIPNANVANLTHGDFDPSNILVNKRNGKWTISAILDWEFAFSGCYLLDMGLFLRYAHMLPNVYTDAFIKGVTQSGYNLPKHWEYSTKLMDLICLLQLLFYNPKQKRPNLNHDVCQLITNTVAFFADFSF
jgi:aminoglycoside phosphotransferase (APT) family kinase protein